MPNEYYKKVELVKRKQILQAYQGVATLMLAIINVDSLEDMRNSCATLGRKLDKRNDVLSRLNAIRARAEELVNHLGEFPSNFEACKTMSDLSGEYNETIRREIIPLCDSLHIPGNKRMSLYIRYGATYQYTEFDTFEKLMQVLATGGYGISHMAWSREKGHQVFSESATDTLRLHLTTRKGVTFDVHPMPGTVNVAGIYQLKDQRYANQQRSIPAAYQPIEVAVSTRGGLTCHSEMLTAAFERLPAQFDNIVLTDFKDRLLCYCPPEFVTKALTSPSGN
jgi:hypothetical protein